MVGRGRQSQEEVAAAARRRLELLGRELEAAGLRRVDDEPAPWEVPDAVEEPPGAEGGAGPPAGPLVGPPVVVRPVGRHARQRPPGVGARLGGGARAWVADALPSTVRGRVGLQRGQALLVVLLVVAGIALAAYVWQRGSPRPVALDRAPASAEPLAELTPSASPPDSPGASTGSAATPSGTGSPGATVVVDVAGKVRRPGVATLPAGSRVVDALEHAGGARQGVDLRGLNLARVLVDGEQVLVGAPVAAAVPAGPGGAAAGAAQAAPDPAGALVSLNAATPEQLETLPGVGPVTAQKILDWRSTHGSFTAVDELLEVDGIGDKTLAEIAPHVTL
ncbi:helix-hairpin-helix domain-containing protein [Nocardioides aurantiacus]|uniref:Competence protein ComEA n=1 Tax=Nocardioides aurantiacus TaxID=86796 RepID=A0A3N2CVV6_9ACTN|nr:helix-hairpin-helix domain-containing protein [Nocardioides aurantiacus]ROR91606.1 competence protein ComEA [Nocardioides aurantiacus]